MSLTGPLKKVVERKQVYATSQFPVEDLLECGHRIWGTGGNGCRPAPASRRCGPCGLGIDPEHSFVPDPRSPGLCSVCWTKHLTGRGDANA